MDSKVNQTLEFYEAKAQHLCLQYEKVELSARIEFIKSYLPAKANILEIGAGSGGIAAKLLQCGFQVTASDASQAMRVEAIKLHPELENKYFLIKLPASTAFSADSLDAVIANAVLMHFNPAELQMIFSEISRILKPGGILYSLIFPKRADTDSSGLDANGRYFNLLNSIKMAELCCSAGLRLEYHEVINEGLGRPGFEVEQAIFRKPTG